MECRIVRNRFCTSVRVMLFVWLAIPAHALAQQSKEGEVVFQWRCQEGQSVVAVAFDDRDPDNLCVKLRDGNVYKLSTRDKSLAIIFAAKNEMTKRSSLVYLKDYIVSADIDAIDALNLTTGKVHHQALGKGHRLAMALKGHCENEVLVAVNNPRECLVFRIKINEAEIVQEKLFGANRSECFSGTDEPIGQISTIAQSEDSKTLLVSYQEGFASIQSEKGEFIDTHYVGDDQDPCRAIGINDAANEWVLCNRSAVSILAEPKSPQIKASVNFPVSKILGSSASPNGRLIAVAALSEKTGRTTMNILDAKTLRVVNHFYHDDWGFAQDVCWNQDSTAVAFVAGARVIALMKVGN
jgi:hypothetical protein